MSLEALVRRANSRALHTFLRMPMNSFRASSVAMPVVFQRRVQKEPAGRGQREVPGPLPALEGLQDRRVGRARALRGYGGTGGSRRFRRDFRILHRGGDGLCERQERAPGRRTQAVRADSAGQGGSSGPGSDACAGPAGHVVCSDGVCVTAGHDLLELLERDGSPGRQAGRQRRQTVLGLHPIHGRLPGHTAVGRVGGALITPKIGHLDNSPVGLGRKR